MLKFFSSSFQHLLKVSFFPDESISLFFDILMGMIVFFLDFVQFSKKFFLFSLVELYIFFGFG